MTKETLHLYRDEDGNVYAARDLAHAKELWTKDTGLPAEESGEWQSIPDDAVIPEYDEDTDRSVDKTAAQHASEVVRPGPIGSTFY